MATITDNDLALFRERAKTDLESTGDIGRIAWDYVVEELCKEVARLRGVSKERGDCAKLREALDESRRIASGLGGCRLNDYWKLNEIVRVCEAALAAPPRNCDKYENAKDAWFAFDALQSKKGAKWHWTEYADWLFAPAQEGGNDGR